MNYFTNGNIYLIGGFLIDNPVFGIGFFIMAGLCYLLSFATGDYK